MEFIRWTTRGRKDPTVKWSEPTYLAIFKFDGIDRALFSPEFTQEILENKEKNKVLQEESSDNYTIKSNNYEDFVKQSISFFSKVLNNTNSKWFRDPE
jgi:hypothetical protein